MLPRYTLLDELDGEGNDLGAVEPPADPPADPPEEPKSALDVLQENLGPEQPEKPEQPPEPQAQTQPVQPTQGGENPLYRIPSGIRGEHRKAYVELVNHAKSLEAQAKESSEPLQQQLEQATEVLSTFQGVIQDAQATPDQMAMAFDVIKAINTGNIDQAIGALHGQLQELARMSGKPVPGIDLGDQLRDFPDLAEAVANAQITKEHALELAKGRRIQQEQQRQQQTQDQQRQYVEKWEQERRSAMGEVKKFLDQQRGADLDFPAKYQALSNNVAALVKGIPPSLWPEKIALFWSQLGAAPPQQTREPTPLRAKSGGGAAPVPKTSEEALRIGLGYGLT